MYTSSKSVVKLRSNDQPVSNLRSKNNSKSQKFIFKDNNINYNKINSIIVVNDSKEENKSNQNDHKLLQNYDQKFIDDLDEFLSKHDYEGVDKTFRSMDQIETFLNFYSVFIGFSNNCEENDRQTKLYNVLSYLLFRNFQHIPCFCTMAVNLLVANKQKGTKPTLEQQIIVFRRFAEFFDKCWFNIKTNLNQKESIVSFIFRKVTVRQPIYIMFLKFFEKHIKDMDIRNISSFCQHLANVKIVSPYQFEFMYKLIQGTFKTQLGPPYHALYFFIKYSINSPFARTSTHFLLPTLIDTIEKHQLIQKSVLQYLRRLIQFSIGSEILNDNKEQREEIAELLKMLYELQVPLLNRIVFEMVESAHFLGCMKNVILDKKRIIEIDKTLVNELKGVKPLEMNLDKCLDFPLLYVPLKKGFVHPAFQKGQATVQTKRERVSFSAE